MNKNSENYLAGKCLVANPNISDDYFKKSLIYICAHDKNGAMGFVINKTIKNLSFKEVTDQLLITTPDKIIEQNIYFGGPTETMRGFVLHTTDYMEKDTLKVNDNFAISSSTNALADIAIGHGPKNNIISLGYANWDKTQLEKEIIRNDWLVLDADFELIFNTDDEDKWLKAINIIGIDLDRLSSISGRA